MIKDMYNNCLWYKTTIL